MCKYRNSLVNQATLTAFMLIFGGLAPMLGSSQAQDLAGELVAASGPVEIRPLGEPTWRAASLRAVLHPGDMVRTGPGGAAEVALVQGIFRMDENTVIILPPPQAVRAATGQPTGMRLLLYRGRALFHLLKERLQSSFDVITPSVIVGVKGTTFGVEHGPAVAVVVFDGSVQVAPTGRPTAPPVTLGAGQFTALVGGQLTGPQPYRPGAPGSTWSGAPTSVESGPLPAAPGGPASGPARTGLPQAVVAGSAAPALARADDGLAVRAVVLSRMDPPRLAAVGGPPGSSGGLATNGVVGGPAASPGIATSGVGGGDGGAAGSHGHGSRGRAVGKGKGKGKD